MMSQSDNTRRAELAKYLSTASSVKRVLRLGLFSTESVEILRSLCHSLSSMEPDYTPSNPPLRGTKTGLPPQ